MDSFSSLAVYEMYQICRGQTARVALDAGPALQGVAPCKQKHFAHSVPPLLSLVPEFHLISRITSSCRYVGIVGANGKRRDATALNGQHPSRHKKCAPLEHVSDYRKEEFRQKKDPQGAGEREKQKVYVSKDAREKHEKGSSEIQSTDCQRKGLGVPESPQNKNDNRQRNCK